VRSGARSTLRPGDFVLGVREGEPRASRYDEHSGRYLEVVFVLGSRPYANRTKSPGPNLERPDQLGNDSNVMITKIKFKNAKSQRAQ
jgi:hypothetical protein